MVIDAFSNFFLSAPSINNNDAVPLMLLLKTELDELFSLVVNVAFGITPVFESIDNSICVPVIIDPLALSFILPLAYSSSEI